MLKIKRGGYTTVSGVFFAVLLSILGLVWCDGSTAASFTHLTPTQPTISTIAAIDAAIVATPYLSGSTVRYLSDCQTGNTIKPATGCVQGSDTLYDGTSPTISGSHGPWQTTTKGATWLSNQTSGTYTLALAQGGVWNAANQTFSINLNGNRYCPLGKTCSEIREYPPLGTGAKPVIYGYNNTSSNQVLFFLGNGQRVMNLSIIGSGTGATSQQAFFLYLNGQIYPPGYVHDDSILNVDIKGFDIAIQEGSNLDQNITIEGNHFVANTNQGYLGGSQNLNLNYNYFQDNGSHDVAAQTHSIYVASHAFITGVNVIGNYVTGYYKGSGATQCTGGPFVLHGSMTNLVVSGNAVIEDTNSNGSCWGISANNRTAAPYGGFYRNALFSDNIIINGGNAGMDVENCPYCVIENNLIIADNQSAQNGISAPPFPARASIAGCTPSPTVQCYDDPSTNYTIRNNTIYFTANVNGGMVGIQVGAASNELQTGHNIFNNTISYLGSASGLQQVYCFDYLLPLSAYTTINNNNCYVPNSGMFSYAWEKTTLDSLTTWTAATGFDKTNSSISNPGFTLSAYPYFTWSDSSRAYQLLNNGTTNIFSPSSTLLGHGTSGPLLDITGTTRPAVPAIGAYE